MMTPPRHQPRRSGRIRSSFRYSADDVRCKDCTRYDSGHPCHLNECVCLEERIEAGVVELNALARGSDAMRNQRNPRCTDSERPHEIRR